jgi:hypothetical protein
MKRFQKNKSSNLILQNRLGKVNIENILFVFKNEILWFTQRQIMANKGEDEVNSTPG